MDIIYISRNAPKSWLAKIIENEVPISIPAYKFNDLIVKGLQKNGVNIHVPVDYSLCRASKHRIITDVIEEKGVKYHILPEYTNKIHKIFIIYKFILNILNQNNDTHIVCDSLQTLPTLIAMICARITKRKIVGIFTDLPQFLHGDREIILSKFKDKVLICLYNKFDGYVVLTEKMNEYVNKKRKSFIVMEGLVDLEQNLDSIESSNKNKICLYAGAIHKKYGISTLVQAFLTKQLNEAELHIYGDGDYRQELEEICKHYSNIKYFGIVPNEEIIFAEVDATLLINPRPTHEEFTKYSFPSKNMEYMLSGTPVLTTKLPGMPSEYYKYVFLAEDESVEGFTENISRILNMKPNELKSFGNYARDFVLKEKNNVYQSGRIISLIKKLK